MKKKILISAVSAIVLLAAGLLLKSNYDSNQSIFLNQNIEALASGDLYYLVDCIVPAWGPDKELDFFCDAETVDRMDIFDCPEEDAYWAPSFPSKCVGEVK